MTKLTTTLRSVGFAVVVGAAAGPSFAGERDVAPTAPATDEAPTAPATERPGTRQHGSEIDLPEVVSVPLPR